MDYPAIFHSPSIPQVADALVSRWERRLKDRSLSGLAELLADTVYTERLRFEAERVHDEEAALVGRAARARGPGGRGRPGRCRTGPRRARSERCRPRAA